MAKNTWYRRFYSFEHWTCRLYLKGPGNYHRLGSTRRSQLCPGGSIFISGRLVQWLRDGLKLIKSAAETEAMACGGFGYRECICACLRVQALLIGICTPEVRFWTNPRHLPGTPGPSTLEAIAYQTRDVIEVMKTEAGLEIPLLRVDGVDRQ
jgi:hypothetical protein